MFLKLPVGRGNEHKIEQIQIIKEYSNSSFEDSYSDSSIDANSVSLSGESEDGEIEPQIKLNRKENNCLVRTV